MEDIAFSDWPGQPMDLSGSNPWLPAYGFQTPTALLEKDDFLGHPDADLFLHGSAGQHYVYLETIQEETSDDLRSESDISDSRASPVGWLATDSETGSVIRIHTLGTFDSSSEREIACPSKRRKQDNLLSVSDDESNQSLSRSSSLIQFESLERQCQDISSSSPSIFSNFSYDSLENQNKNVSPDSLEKNYNSEPESDYYKSLKIDLSTDQKRRNSFNRYSESDSSDSTESEDTLDTAKYGSSKSVNNLKTWRSFDGLHSNNNILRTNKVSSENLSEDSGYSDHFCQYNKNKSSSIPNIAMLLKNEKFEQHKFNNNNNCYLEKYRLKNCKDFDAYDGDIFQNFNGNFGVSYQDLSILDKYEFCESKSPLIERFIKNNSASRKISNAALNLDTASESIRSPPKYNQQTSSEPNLLSNNRTVNQKVCDKKDFFVEGCVFVCSVPKDLNLVGKLTCERNSWPFTNETISIATKNFDLADFKEDIVEENKMERRRYRKKGERIVINLKQQQKNAPPPRPSSDTSSENGVNYKREGSYLEAMENMVDMSDDEHNPCYRDKINRSTIVEFDRQILKAISEQSIAGSMVSLGSVKDTMDILFLQPIASQNRNVKSTPNLASYKNEQIDEDEDDANKRNSMLEMPRKSSLINRSASTSENEDKTLTASTKSINGSTNSKGVHFCPVVAEVNWRDSASTERDSSYSLSSTPRSSPTKLIRPEPRMPDRMSTSQPELQQILQKEKPGSFVPIKQRHSISQPNVCRQKNSKLCKELDNEMAYVDKDGVAYKHTHLGNVYKSPPTTSTNKTTTTSTTSTISSDSHVANSVKQEVKATKPVSAMEPAVVRRDSSKSSSGKSGKLGGFFSRIASFRFTKGKNDDKNKAKKKSSSELNKNAENVTGQRLATKEDYIYIPLKGPMVNNDRKYNSNAASKVQVDIKQDENACISAKPPLPKLPPRVVGASVKKRAEATALQATPDRRTIDSGDSLPQPMEPMGLIETDLDTEVTVITSGAHVKTRSLMNLGAEAPPRSLAAPSHPNRPHKSMEFLLDKQNLKVVEPPENELQKGERVMSEHQLRVQRSLQKLTVPDWYKQSEVPREGFLLKKSPCRETRWTGTNSKTTSLSSLGSSNQSPLVLSPTPQNQPFVRWSTSKLNSTASSPCASTRSSFNTRQPNGSISPSSLRSSFSYRQPYLGWRSQERLSRPRTPAERLASSLLSQNHQQPHHPQESPEIQTSIKEVTSAIVHYVSGLKPEDGRDGSDGHDTRSQRSLSVSPRGSQKLCWLESSFVGTRPLDSPQTPITLSESQTSTPVPPSTLRLDLHTHNGESIHA